MTRRLKVLISAYACEPGKGSEPEVGWQWCLHLAQFHDVTVLTRANNRANIERELEQLRGQRPVPEFVYHDERPLLLSVKRVLQAHKLYYLLWQRSARDVVAQLHRTHHFDLLHHVTYAGFRFPTAIWGHGVPCIWGPIGGMESVPLNLLPWSHPQSLIQELGRDYNNMLQAGLVNLFAKRARASTAVLTSTVETQSALARLGFRAELMPAIGLDTKQFSEPPARPAPQGPLKLLFVGNIITLKGVNLAIRALKESGTDACLTFIGSGNFLAGAKRLTEKLGLHRQVEFKPRIPRAEVLETYRQYDVFLFPSLHDSGGYVVIEAMLSGLPVICLDCGGPAIAVEINCGRKVPLGTRTAVISNLAAAIKHYDQDREQVRQHGQSARQTILARYDWQHKAEQMDLVYTKALQRAVLPDYQKQLKTNYSGVGHVPRFLSTLFSSKGVMTSFLLLLLIGTLGFISTNFLRAKAEELVEDNLPSLSYAGAANANLAQGFNRTVLLVVTDDTEKRAQLEFEIQEFTSQTSRYLDQYERQISDPATQDKMVELKRARDDYMQLRDRVLELARHGERNTALAIINTKLLPAYDRYKAAGESVLSLEIAEGQSRGHTIMRVCLVTQIVVAVTSVMLFLAGFLIGIFK